MKLQIDQYVIYPAHGVVRVTATKNHPQTEQPMYVLRTSRDRTTFVVPESSVETLKIRELSGVEEIHDMFKVLAKRNFKLDYTTWNRRYREYNEKLQSGQLFDIAEVVRNLLLIRNDKNLSFGERKMLDVGMFLLSTEVGLVLGISTEEASQRIANVASGA